MRTIAYGAHRVQTKMHKVSQSHRLAETQQHACIQNSFEVMVLRTFSPGTVRDMRGTWQCIVKYRDSEDEPWKTLTKMTNIPVRGKTGRRMAETEAKKWRDDLLIAEVVKTMEKRFEDKLAEELGHRGQGSQNLSRTVIEYGTDYINNHKLSRTTGRPLEDSSRSGYISTMKNQIEPYLPNDLLVCEVTPEHIENLLFTLQVECGYSQSTVSKTYNLLNSIFCHACSRDGLESNPCEAVRPPKKGRPKKNSLSVADATALAKQLSQLEPSRGVTAGRLALACGLRRGELAALQIKNCGLTDGLLHVSAAVSKGGEGGYGATRNTGKTHIKVPKTNAGERTIPVNPEMEAAIRDRIVALKAECAQEGTRFNQDLYLLGYPNGKWIAPNNLGKEWTAISKVLGYRGMLGQIVTLHDLRHSFATYALAKKVNVMDVKSVMGHSSASMTLDVYADSDPEERIRSMQQVSRI